MGNAPQNVLPLTSEWPLMAFKLSFLSVPRTFCANQEMSSVSPRLPCGQSGNCKSLKDVSAAVRTRSFSVCKRFPQNRPFFPGWAHVRLYSCSLSSAPPTIITVELQRKHLAALATCKENVTFVYLRLKHAEPLIFQLQSISPGKIELSQQKETQSIPLDGFNKVKVNSVTCGGTSAES